MRARLPSLVVLLMAVALIGAGCGEDEPSAEDAQASYQSIQTRIENLGATIARELQAAGGGTDAALIATLADLQEQANATAEQLGDLEVPDELVQERDELRDALQQGAEDLGGVRDAVRDADAQAAREAVQDLVADSQEIREARTEFEQALEDATR